MMKFSNNYFILRHGEAVSNKRDFVSCWPEKRENPITEKGKKQVQRAISKLKKEKIDLIFSSDVLRAKQTAQMVAEGLGLKINPAHFSGERKRRRDNKNKKRCGVNFDKRLREINVGIFNGKSIKEWNSYFVDKAKKFTKRAPGAENRRDIKKRMKDFIEEIDKKYKNENILIISHENPLIVLRGVIKGFSEKEMAGDKWEKLGIDTGELRKLL